MEERDTASGTTPEIFVNLARAAKGLALLLFTMPWLTVSCSGQPFLPMSGYQLATGTVRPPAGLPIDSADLASQSADLLLVLAAALIVAAIAATFVLARRLGLLVAIAACAAALGLLIYDVPIRLLGNMRARLPDAGAADANAVGNAAAPVNDFQRQFGQAVTVDIQIAFWLTLAALIAAMVLLYRAYTRSGPADSGIAPH